MSSRLAVRSTRSARFALAAAAMVALTATLTACDSGGESSTGKAGRAANAGSTVEDNDVDGAKDDYYDEDSGSAGKDNDVDGAKDDYYDEDGGKDNDVDGAKQDHYAKPCDNGDLDFSLKLESQAGGYYLVTAKAKPGVVCLLQGAPEQVMFGSDPDTVASNAEEGSGDSIKLKGSTVAYVGVNPKGTNNDEGKMFETLIVSVSDDGDNAGQLTVESADVDRPQVTNWHANSADVVTPFL
ncbi:DUF4232 domain-containing protein [Streptomyces sp. NPDC058665]|uniref:DUF4232 domain-containing protein n=1 Tax=Streptomyces sp. NPDC058665 TaxID=3346586 RepID=UPI0036595823